MVKGQVGLVGLSRPMYSILYESTIFDYHKLIGPERSPTNFLGKSGAIAPAIRLRKTPHVVAVNRLRVVSGI